jgi:excinuclease ABC subunit A
MPFSDVTIRGAREHNLQDIDVVLPRNQLICLTGVSGSGKSSLAFDTVYAEGQRRYVESLSSFARQFLGQMPKPDVDLIAGLSPSISISQKSSGTNPRSTVGTITEIYDYLRVLFARVGQGYCPKCGERISAQTREEILTSILSLAESTKFSVLAPVIHQQKGEYRDLFEDLRKQGFGRVRVDGQIYRLDDVPALDRQMRHDIEVVVDRLTIQPDVRTRLGEAIEVALKLGEGTMMISLPHAHGDSQPETRPKRVRGKRGGHSSARGAPAVEDKVYSADYACTTCEISFAAPTPQLFSFNSPQGMCPNCDGLGRLYTFDPDLLIPDDGLSFKKGCVEILGTWKDLGRWRRHIYQGVADTIERLDGHSPPPILETPWRDLAPEIQKKFLWGNGRSAYHLHVARRFFANEVWRKIRGNHPGVAQQVPHQQEPSAAKKTGKVHANDRV